MKTAVLLVLMAVVSIATSATLHGKREDVPPGDAPAPPPCTWDFRWNIYGVDVPREEVNWVLNGVFRDFCAHYLQQAKEATTEAA